MELRPPTKRRKSSLLTKFESNHSGIETPCLKVCFPDFTAFESNHSGIETAGLKNLLVGTVKFESNHSGIETVSPCLKVCFPDYLNRTIVELRPQWQ